MKKILDPTQSKRPIMVPDDEDVKSLETAREKAMMELIAIEKAISRLESPEYAELVKESKQEMIEIALAAMEIDASDVKKIARAQGQFFERKRLTEKMARLKMEANTKENFITGVTNQIRFLIQRIQKMKVGKHNGR